MVTDVEMPNMDGFTLTGSRLKKVVRCVTCLLLLLLD